MNAVLEEIYSTILPSAPYVVAAYALVFVCLLVWVLIMFNRQNNLDKKLTALEEEICERTAEK